MKIKDALNKLDPKNNDHWTSDGSPRLDVLKDILGKSVTREQLKSAANGFSRSNSVQVVEAEAEEAKGISDEEQAKLNLEKASLDLAKAQAAYQNAVSVMDVFISKNDRQPGSIDIKAYQRSQQEQRIKQRDKQIKMNQMLSGL